MKTRLLALTDQSRLGLYISGTIAVPLGTTRVGVAIQRKGFLDIGTDVLQAVVEVSPDGGVTWGDVTWVAGGVA